MSAEPDADGSTSLLIDDRSSGSLHIAGGRVWRIVTDTVMGGLSSATLEPARTQDRPCLHMRGEVSLENSGGFVQATLDLVPDGFLDASAYRGIEIDVCGNGASYNLHLRTADTRIVWQSYRAGFIADTHWQTLKIPFQSFRSHRIDTPLDTTHLRRLGVVAIGRAMRADISFGRLALYA